ncbi:MAG: tRNA adenosine(34) deaminase TadA [Planctomycetota bacterium]|nr:tRNA adenosine(34) deaminase TadA [Planctomycetota bacterium]
MPARALWMLIGRRLARPAPSRHDPAPHVPAGLDPAPRAPGVATPRDLEAMERALDLADVAARMGEVPVGAVVYDTATGRTLGEGFNRRERDHAPDAHAELLAIRAAARTIGDWRLNAATLVVTLEPCAMCAGLIVNARVGRLVYGTRDPKAGAAGSLMRLTEDPRLNHRVVPIEGVCQARCADLLRTFFRTLRARRNTPAGEPDARTPRG